MNDYLPPRKVVYESKATSLFLKDIIILINN